MTATDYIAIYGASVATLVLIWDGFKWFANGPRLRATAKCHVGYLDSRITRTEQTESGKIHHLAEYCHIEVVNIGDRPTTLTSIDGTHDCKKGAAQLFNSSALFVPHQGKQLPLTLGPGEVWSARLEMPLLYSLAARGKPVIRIHASHTTDPVTVRPDFERELLNPS